MSNESSSANSQCSVNGIVMQAMRDHLRSAIAGNDDRIRADFLTPEAESQANRPVVVPAGARDFTILENAVDETGSHIRTRIIGDTTADSVWTWRLEGGKYRITSVDCETNGLTPKEWTAGLEHEPSRAGGIPTPAA